MLQWPYNFYYTAAAEANEQRGFSGLRVHGLLTDLSNFHFYSYDPKEKMFYADAKFHLYSSRRRFVTTMVQGTMHFVRSLWFSEAEIYHL